MPCASSRFSSQSVLPKWSKLTRKPSKSALCSCQTRSISCLGVMPSDSARSMIGVPWVSSAPAYQTSCPRMR